MLRLKTIVFVLLAVILPGCTGPALPLDVVDYVDLERYTGTWYEIARYPVFFEEGCVGVTAEYVVISKPLT